MDLPIATLEYMEVEQVKKDHPYLGNDYELIAFVLAGRLAIERRNAEHYRNAYYEKVRGEHVFN